MNAVGSTGSITNSSNIFFIGHDVMCIDAKQAQLYVYSKNNSVIVSENKFSMLRHFCYLFSVTHKFSNILDSHEKDR